MTVLGETRKGGYVTYKRGEWILTQELNYLGESDLLIQGDEILMMGRVNYTRDEVLIKRRVIYLYNG